MSACNHGKDEPANDGGTGETRWDGLVTALAGLMNIIDDYCLIFRALAETEASLEADAYASIAEDMKRALDRVTAQLGVINNEEWQTPHTGAKEDHAGERGQAGRMACDS